MDASIQQQVFEIVARQGDIDATTLTMATTLKDLGVDSLEAIETIFEIEEHFDINFPDRDPSLDDGSLGSLVGAVERALAAKAMKAAAIEPVAPATPAH